MQPTPHGTIAQYNAKRISFLCVTKGLTSAADNLLWGLVKTCRDSLGGGAGSPVDNWARKVVVAGGAAPSSATKTALKTFYSALNLAGLLPKMVAVNPFVPDNLIASTVPLIWEAGNEQWTNHNFVAGDLTVNGLIGDGMHESIWTRASLPQARLRIFQTTARAFRSWSSFTPCFNGSEHRRYAG